jgi:hypothetical protein
MSLLFAVDPNLFKLVTVWYFGGIIFLDFYYRDAFIEKLGGLTLILYERSGSYLLLLLLF